MTPESRQDSEMARFEQLLAQWRNGGLTSEERAELTRLLGEPGLRAELVSEWLMDEAIYHTLRARPGPASEAMATQAQPAQARSLTQLRPARRRGFRWLEWHEVRISLGWCFGMATTACLVLVGLWFYLRTTPAGRLATVRGEVTIEHARGPVPARAEALIYQGDRVHVPAGGAAVVVWNNESTRIELREGTDLEVGDRLRGKRLWLRTGALEAEVAPQSRWRPMTIGTPQAEVQIVGTHFSLSATPGLTRLDVFSGEVRLLKTLVDRVDQRREVSVRGGQTVSAAPALKLDVQYLTGLLSSDVWAVPPGTELTEAPAKGTVLAGDAVADAAPAVERLRGYLIAPQTGGFTFWVGSFGGDQPVELWMSPDDNPGHKRRLASYTPGTTAGRARGPGNAGRVTGQARTLIADWSRSASQKSAPQSLVKDRRYYVEIWHGGVGLPGLGLGWRRPSDLESTPPQPVDIQTLCPFVEANRTSRE